MLGELGNPKLTAMRLLQGMIKMTLEKIERTERMGGTLNQECWHTLAGCNEAVQREVVKDLTNAAWKADWQLSSVAGWTLRSCIPRHKKKILGPERCAHGMGG